MRSLCICAVVIAGLLPGAAAAQDPTVVVPSPIMVVDFDSLIGATQYGQRIQGAIAAERERVQAENDRIAAELLAEEAALTESRATMAPADFREAARAFNERAQIVRGEREAEQAKLLQLRDAERDQFLERIRPIILALMLERGAVVTMDRRAVYQAIGGANATQDAVDLIDRTLGDGRQNPNERPTLRPLGELVVPEEEQLPIQDPIAPEPIEIVPDLPADTDDLLQTE